MPALVNKITEHTWKQRMVLASLSLLFVACTQTNPAQIRDITGTAMTPGSRSTTAMYRDPTPSYQSSPRNIQVTHSVQLKPNYRKPKGTTPGMRKKTITTTSVERIMYSRDYDSIPKGGYKGNFYTVKRGDTLFYIAWITGNDYRALAAQNRITPPYDLRVGHVLNVQGNASVLVTKKNTKTIITSISPEKNARAMQKLNETPVKPTTEKISPPPSMANTGLITWHWPAQGKIIEPYSLKSKGIDIGGKPGEKVVAAASGQVVYAGNALPGYGNLIIVKHNDDYLTAYAHNQAIMVKEQQRVNAGDQIATMGNTGTSSIRLHFEIRYKAKSVDPLKYLPKVK